MLEEMGRPYQLIEKSTGADDLQTVDFADRTDSVYGAWVASSRVLLNG